MKIITRVEAKAKGLIRFCTGKPCKYGHVDERLVCNSNCVACSNARGRVVLAEWNATAPEVKRACWARWRAANPEKTAAKDAVNAAVRRGKLVRQPCFVCGDLKVEGHHSDYSQPLSVVWLCSSHHKELHSHV